MTVRKIEVERISVKSTRPFEFVVEALEGAIGHPNIGEFFRDANKAQTFAETENVVDRSLGPTDLMLFMKLDLGGVLRKETGLDRPRIVRYLIGNPLIMKEMTKHVPDAGSYAPVTILVDERPDGVYLAYDRMVSLLAPYENAEALKVARALDSKIEALLSSVAN